jgi:hypothetical protein
VLDLKVHLPYKPLSQEMILLAREALTCPLDKIRADTHRAYLSGIDRMSGVGDVPQGDVYRFRFRPPGSGRPGSRPARRPEMR